MDPYIIEVVPETGLQTGSDAFLQRLTATRLLNIEEERAFVILLSEERGEVGVACCPLKLNHAGVVKNLGHTGSPGPLHPDLRLALPPSPQQVPSDGYGVVLEGPHGWRPLHEQLRKPASGPAGRVAKTSPSRLAQHPGRVRKRPRGKGEVFGNADPARKGVQPVPCVGPVP
jgi:hypothetical protein